MTDDKLRCARERTISLWFEMWLRKQDLGIGRIFCEDAVYTESWGPEYVGIEKIKLWFFEWNARGTVLVWDIGRFFHTETSTAAQWFFKNRLDGGAEECFDGMTVAEWRGGKIKSLKEFGCNVNRYDPYKDGLPPKFADVPAKWF